MTADSEDRFVRAFDEHGYGTISQALAPADALRLRRRVEQHEAFRPAADPAPSEMQLPRIVERDSDCYALATQAPMLALLRRIFGTTPRLAGSYAHLKPPHTAAHTTAHSDVAHLPGVPHHLSTLMIKVMWALSPTDAGSGAVKVIPGSHRLEQHVGTAPALGDVIAVAPGDVLMFHANLLHTATANRSDQYRVSVWFTYALPWMRVMPGHEFGDAFLSSVRADAAHRPELAPLFGLTDPYATQPAGRP